MTWTGPIIADLTAKVGVPFVVLIIILFQLGPKIDRGIEIADHVDAEMQYLAVRGCAPASLLPTP